MENRQLRLDIAIGAVYNNKKLIATKHVGSMIVSEDGFDIKREVDI